MPFGRCGLDQDFTAVFKLYQDIRNITNGPWGLTNEGMGKEILHCTGTRIRQGKRGIARESNARECLDQR